MTSLVHKLPHRSLAELKTPGVWYELVRTLQQQLPDYIHSSGGTLLTMTYYTPKLDYGTLQHRVHAAICVIVGT